MAELQQRIKGYHQPYHRALRGLLDAAHRQHGVAYHLNCHSMNATSGAMGESGAGQLLAGMGFDVAVNHPFKGVERVRTYANPAATACSWRSTSGSTWTRARLRRTLDSRRCKPG